MSPPDSSGRGYLTHVRGRTMPEPTQSGFAPVPDGRLYYERAGGGPPIVLIHSAFLDQRMWDPQFAAYSAHHTVVRYDVRGQGQSKGDRTNSSDGEDLAALLNHLNLPTAFVLGNSNGARIACEFAAGLPDRVTGLILVAGNPHDLEPTEEEKARFMNTFADGEGRLIDVVRAGRKVDAIDLILNLWAPRVPAPDRDRLRLIASDNYDPLVKFLTEGEPEGRLPAYPVASLLRTGRIPILSLSGAHDNPAVNMMMGRFAAEVPSARHFELTEGDHTPSLSAQAEFDARVLEFLARIEGGQPWPPPDS